MSGRTRATIRMVAWIEMIKGVAVLLVATGLLLLVHDDLHAVAARIVSHLHLSPTSRYPHAVLDLAAHLEPGHIAWLAVGGVTYALVRFAEAYGLFHERAWAEWLAALSSGIYVPIEIAELIRRPSVFVAVVLVLNLIVVAVMAVALRRRRRPAESGST